VSQLGWARGKKLPRQAVFFEDQDCNDYLKNLKEWKQALGLKVYSYCLMTNHVHLVAHSK
jgi:putative transposase